jgi:hypothetical protein
MHDLPCYQEPCPDLTSPASLISDSRKRRKCSAMSMCLVCRQAGSDPRTHRTGRWPTLSPPQPGRILTPTALHPAPSFWRGPAEGSWPHRRCLQRITSYARTMEIAAQSRPWPGSRKPPKRGYPPWGPFIFCSLSARIQSRIYLFIIVLTACRSVEILRFPQIFTS